MAAKGKGSNVNEAGMGKQLDSILSALQTLLIIEGHDAGISKAKVRAIVQVADGRVSKVWRELEAARKAREKKEVQKAKNEQ